MAYLCLQIIRNRFAYMVSYCFQLPFARGGSCSSPAKMQKSEGGVGAFSDRLIWKNLKIALPLGKKITGAFLRLCVRAPFDAFPVAKYLVSYI